jgi:hypothetical protein
MSGQREGPATTPGPHKITPSTALLPASVTDWSDTFECAQLWVSWTGRRRWPTFAYNDDLWALSVAAWEHNGQAAS